MSSLVGGAKKTLQKIYQKPGVLGGYTIIEVMVVLGITGVLLSSAVVVFGGQQSKTALSQNLYDLASKIQSYGSQVNSGVYSDAQNYTCGRNDSGPVPGPRLTLSGGATTGSNQDCLFLGRALQIIPGQNNLYAYTVLGYRVDSLGQSVTNFNQANPLPALDNDLGWQLVDTYPLPSDEAFVSSTVTDQNGNNYKNYDLVGLYIDLSGSGSSTNLSVRGYNFPNTASNTPKSVQVLDCIQQQAPCAPSSYIQVRTWQICISAGSKQGSLTIESGTGGLATSVDAEECS